MKFSAFLLIILFSFLFFFQFVFVLPTYAENSLVSVNKLNKSPSPELWKFSTSYKYLTLKENYLVNLQCKNDCLALNQKKLPLNFKNDNGQNSDVKICFFNNGKVVKGSYKNRIEFFCEFKDRSVLQLNGVRKKWSN